MVYIDLNEKECNKILRLIEQSWMQGLQCAGDVELYDKIHLHRQSMTDDKRTIQLTR